jgi:transcriptional regulator with XRE-family HTH domain
MSAPVISVRITLPELPPLAAIGAAARAVRQAQGLSLRAAAKQIGTSFNTLGRIERGEVDCSYETALAVVAWLQQQEIGTCA